MPRKPIDYSKTHFYKIVCKDLNITDCYVGHTTDFAKRKYQHSHTSNNKNNKKYNILLYDFIRRNGHWENFEMILINTEFCENNLEARKRERFYKEQLNASLNTHLPFTTIQEYKEKMDIWKKEYKKENSEKLSNYSKEYRHKNQEHIKEVKQKRYQENKLEISKKHKDYYDKKKAEILLKNSQKLICDCGKTYTYGHRLRHQSTKYHTKYIQSKQ